MAVAHDNAVESHTGTTGAASVASFTWTHNPVGTPKGILVFVVNMDSATGITSSVTYGGVNLIMSTNGVAADTATEAGRCAAWFLGDAAAIAGRSGNAVIVNRTNNSNVMYAVSITVTATGDTVLHEPGVVVLQEDGTLAEQSVTDGGSATASVRYAGGMSGLNSVPGVGASSTALQSIDIGNQTAATCRETTAGTGARNVGFSSGTSDDRAMVHLAIREAKSVSFTPSDTAQTFSDSIAFQKTVPTAPFIRLHNVNTQAVNRAAFY